MMPAARWREGARGGLRGKGCERLSPSAGGVARVPGPHGNDCALEVSSPPHLRTSHLHYLYITVLSVQPRLLPHCAEGCSSEIANHGFGLYSQKNRYNCNRGLHNVGVDQTVRSRSTPVTPLWLSFVLSLTLFIFISLFPFKLLIAQPCVICISIFKNKLNY